MAVRVTDWTDVSTILDTDLGQTIVERFIVSASMIVDQQLVGEGLSADLLKEIELYLAAHFCTLRDPRTAQEKADGVEFRYEGKTGEGLKASHYGAMALTLDPTGKLSDLSDAKRLSFIARVGTEIDYEQIRVAD